LKVDERKAARQRCFTTEPAWGRRQQAESNCGNPIPESVVGAGQRIAKSGRVPELESPLRIDVPNGWLSLP
jgi:hypothetical protein